MAEQTTEPSIAKRPLWIVPVQGLLAICIALVSGNLLLGFDLPGAAIIEDLVFSAVTAVYLWLTDAEWRLPFVAMLAGATGIAAFFFRNRFSLGWSFWLSFAALALLAGQVGFVTFGLLMEKSAAISIGAGLVLFFLWPKVFKAFPQDEPRPMGLFAKAVAVGFSLATLYYLFAMLETNPMGYQVLSLGDKASQGRTWQTIYCALVALSTLMLAVMISRKIGIALRLWRVLASSGLALVVLATFSLIPGRHVLFLSTAAMIVPVFLLCEAIRGWGLDLLPGLSLSPRRTVPGMFLLIAVAGFCMLHAYAFRVFDCPDELQPELTRLSQEPEVFRILHDVKRNQLWMVQRTRSRILRRDLSTGEEVAVSIGPEFDSTKALPGTPEDLIFTPDRSLLYATFNPLPQYSAELGRHESGKYNDVVLAIDPESAQAVQVVAVPDLCWINCIRWDHGTGRLLIGCEDRPEMLSWDPESKQIEKRMTLESVGDIQDLEIDRREEPGRMYAISLWFTGKVSELSAQTWEVMRQTTIGGTNYEMTFSPATETLFVSRFYESRVVMVNRRTMEKVSYLPTGLGTRALAVDDSRGLLLVSSIYDGLVRVYDFHYRRLIASYSVGGHVKSIALDERAGVAYFSGQCGLFKLDLNAFR